MTAKQATNIATIDFTPEQIATITSVVVATIQAMNGDVIAAEQKPTAKAPKAPKAKTAKAPKPKHDPVLDTKRVERMTRTACDKVAAAGYEPKTRKQGTWMWLYPSNSEGRSEQFKAIKLAKGWKHSPKRGAFYRDFSQA